MAYKRIEVDSDNHEASFYPSLEADFTPIKITYPPIANQESAEAFRHELQSEVTTACGQVACKANVRLAISDSMLDERTRRHHEDDLSWLNGATIQCSTNECPLDSPSK